MENVGPVLGTRTVSVDVEVRGEIQGLYFMNYCKEEASKMGIFGWVKLTNRGTILGIIQGEKPKVQQMIYWLTSKGSPGSRIDVCHVSNNRHVARPEYRNFTIRM